ncbi:t-SNARE [Lipomyces arxii]|uniref:t-SNARE n=1 Tax=Lipomyces arxii TaxID=56418 RepID=UPI0034CFDDBA
MFRDRTNLYLSYRQSYVRHPVSFIQATSSNTNTISTEDRNPLLSDDVTIEMDVLPPSWTDIGDEVNELLELIQDKSTKLDKLHSDHVLPGFDDRTRQEQVIEDLTKQITEHFHECQRLINKFETLLRDSNPTLAQINMSKNMQISLATRVQDVSTRFRKKQSAYLKTLRSNRAASLPLITTTSDPEDDLDISFSQSQIQQSATVSQSSTDATIRQRESEITQIAEGILELATIFKDLQTMVIDQGTMLDRIDYNIETTKIHIVAAEKDLTKAAHYQRRSQKCKVIIFLSLCVFLLLVVVYFKLTSHSSPSPNPYPSPTLPDTSNPQTPQSDEDSGIQNAIRRRIR